MAVVSQNQADQQSQNQTGNSQQNTSGGNGAGITTVSPGSKTGSGGSSNAAPTVQNAQGSQNNAPSTSGSFTNLKSYLNANNGGQQFTQQINNNLNQQGQQIQSNVNNASQQFNQQAQGVVNPIQQNYNNFQQNGGATGDATAITNYTKANNDNASSIRNLENASYTGPKSLNDLSGNNNGAAIQSNINNYSSLVNNAQTEPGRFSLLQNMFGGQGYNQGQQTLDNVFIDPSKLGASRSAANQTQNNFTQAANTATNQAQNYQNQVQGMAQGTIGGLNNAVMNENTGIQNEYQAALGNQNNLFNQYTGDLKSGKISQDEATKLGLTSGTDIYNVDPSQFLNKANLTTNNVAGAQDYANIAALNNLVGQNATAPSSQVLAQYANAQQQITPDKYLGYDATGLQNAAQLAGQQYSDAINSAPVGWGGQSVMQTLSDSGRVPFLGGGNGSNLVLDPKTGQFATYSQLGINGMNATGNQGGINTLTNLWGDSRAGGATNDLVNWAKSQGFQTGTSLNPDQQAQVNALQGQLDYTNAHLGDAGGQQQVQNLQNQINQIQSQGQQVINDSNFFQKEGPLQFLAAMAGNQQFSNDTGWAPGVGLASDALAQLQSANNTYTPTRQLQITPDAAQSSALQNILNGNS